MLAVRWSDPLSHVIVEEGWGERDFENQRHSKFQITLTLSLSHDYVGEGTRGICANNVSYTRWTRWTPFACRSPVRACACARWDISDVRETFSAKCPAMSRRFAPKNRDGNCRGIFSHAFATPIAVRRRFVDLRIAR